MTTKTQPIVVIGGGGHAKVLLSVLSRIPRFKVLGYVDPRDCGEVLGFSRIGGDDALPALAGQKDICAVIGVGKVKAQSDRLKLLAQLKSLGFELPAIVAPSALVAADCSLGEGSVVMDGAVIQPGCVIGRAGIINTGAILDHDCVLGDDVHVGPGAALSGQVTLGDGCLFGVGACAIQGVRIVGGCTVGAGAAVTSDCLEAGTYLGVPARIQR